MGVLKGDVEFVRDVVRRAGHVHMPAINLLWAGIVFCGSAIVEFRPQWAPVYWGTAGVGGWLVSAFLGARRHSAIGQVSVEDGLRQALHWGGLVGACVLAVLLMTAGELSWHGLGSTILLLVALSYFQAGVHLEPGLKWVGAAMAVGFAVTLLVPMYPWLLAGTIIAAALVAQAFLGGRSHGASSR